MQDESLLFIEVGAALGVIALTSVPALAGLVRQLQSRKPKDHFYEDKDGKATAESSAAFSNRWPKTFIFLFAFLGLAVSLANSILATLSLHTGKYDSLFIAEWLSTGVSILLALQAVSITASNDSVQAYSLGLWLWLSGLIFAAVQVLQDTKVLDQLLSTNPVSFGLKIASLALTVGLIVTSVTLPRRPDVYFEGKVVDRLRTVPAYSRFTWGWCSGIIDMATKKKDLDASDLPKPDHWTRSEDAAASWKSYDFKPDSNLWWSIIWAYRVPLFVQWSIAISKAFLNLAPSWITLQILETLQRRKPGEDLPADIWILVFWLGLVILADAWVEATMFWLSWAELCIPLRGALSALIFEKSMRRKNVKAASKQEADEKEDEADAKDDKKKKSDEEEAEDDNVLKSKQAIINLIGVDAKRISDFAAFQFLFPSSAAKLLVAIWFLVYLLGWGPLGAGLLAWAVLLPINFSYAKVYSKAQDKLMKIRDQKLAVVNEALVGMRQIKFSALEPQWEKRILAMREKELGALWQVFKGDTVLFGMWITSPIALAAVSLAVYAWINGTLIPSVAFVSIGVFKNLEVTLAVLPELITDVIDANISVKRMQDYLNGPEKTKTVTEGSDVAFQNATIAWPVDDEVKDEDRFILRNIDVTFPAGELSVISGKTGTGKSLMLAAVLGESDLLSGTIYAPKPPSINERNDDKANRGNWIIPSSISFVGQIPWIENATLRSNILFGLPFDEERYNQTIEACALKKDLEMLSDGDKTELGANGINLSGGQKWRLTLARAIYSRAGILVLDDIFSAVDAHVGRHIYEKCLTGDLCQGRTRILVTHHVALCEPRTKFIVELGDGTVQHSGFLSELTEDGTLQMIKSHEQSSQEIADEEATAVNSEQASDIDVPEVAELNGDGGVLKKVPSKAARAFVEDEAREKGSIKKHVYAAYLSQSGGLPWWGFGFLLFVIYQFIVIGRSWWLRIWTGTSEQSIKTFNQQPQHQFAYAVTLQHSELHVPSQNVSISMDKDTLFYLGVYVGISAFSAILGTGRFFYFFVMSYKASRRMFEGITRTVLRTPLRWLDTVPTGRVLNRFTADFNVIDNRLGMDLSGVFGAFLSVIGICVTAFYVSPLIIPLAFILLLIAVWIAMRYLAGARPAKRLESTTKSPIFDLFGSTLVGMMTIRGSDKAQTYIDSMYSRLDDYGMASWHLWLFNRWMGWRMSLIGAMFSTAVGFVVLGSPSMGAALAGFTLSFALEFSQAIVWSIRHYANIELDMNAAERVVEYSDLKTEDQGGVEPPATWPTEGKLEVKNLVVSYAEDLSPVLKGLTFSVNKNERIGVVGRTGAGKSSLTLALFRFLEARSGSIFVDGLDISKIKLHELRSRLAIIPQDPVLFSGSIRSNLDPFDNQADADLKDSLQRVHLVDSNPATPSEPSSSAAPSIDQQKNVNVFRNLNSPISEGGGNLSQGQRQLLCLARAIVSRPKVMVLDEATSAVDMATDALIQRSIREEFNDSTLIVIAHRLSTIADFDRILVLSDGAVAEYGSPQELWAKDGGVFRGMCEESGEKEKLKNIIFS
ncbi:ABC transporter [Colletotrichum orchidophilum]|uniref:ABC transporter n=1 Tax=Colletotrichum orchidophilum TaxID=1209926 RepID=A0A1G4B5I2_9PEZI|nr:ABC transporter [Colletotrichum orchidophilum]OHE96667.1 ABC transporter [Colletotrichum orchidophilum]